MVFLACSGIRILFWSGNFSFGGGGWKLAVRAPPPKSWMCACAVWALQGSFATWKQNPLHWPSNLQIPPTATGIPGKVAGRLLAFYLRTWSVLLGSQVTGMRPCIWWKFVCKWIGPGLSPCATMYGGCPGPKTIAAISSRPSFPCKVAGRGGDIKSGANYPFIPWCLNTPINITVFWGEHILLCTVRTSYSRARCFTYIKGHQTYMRFNNWLFGKKSSCGKPAAPEQVALMTILHQTR